MKIKNCKECNKEFTPKRTEQMFCSHTCSVKHNKKKENFGTIAGLSGYKKYKSINEGYEENN